MKKYLLALTIIVASCGFDEAGLDAPVAIRQPLMKPGTWQCNWWEDPSPGHVLLIRLWDGVCMGIGTNVTMFALENYTWPDGQLFGNHRAWFKARRSAAGQGAQSVFLGDLPWCCNTTTDGPDHVKWHFDSTGWSDPYFTSFGTPFLVRNISNLNW
jgi:hypothetical protein